MKLKWFASLSFVVLILGISTLSPLRADESTFRVNPVLGYRDDGSVMHIFKGFGFYADQLTGAIDLRSIDNIPEDFRDLYFINIEEFSKLKRPIYNPSCHVGPTSDEMVEFRKKSSLIVFPIQKRVESSTGPLNLKFSTTISKFGRIVKNVEIDFSGILKNMSAVRGKSITSEYEEDLNANLSCDSTGSISQSMQGHNQFNLLVCSFTAGHGEASSNESFHLDLNQMTILNQQTAVQYHLKKGAKETLTFSDNRVGVNVISKIQLPYSNYGGASNGYLILNNKTYSCGLAL